MAQQSYPAEVLQDIKNFFINERKVLEKRLRQVTDADPFQDPDHAHSNADVGEDANEEVQHEQAQANRETLQKKMKDIDQGLQRIEKGTYGYCQQCHNMIDTDRLSSNPYTLLCISCARKGA